MSDDRVRCSDVDGDGDTRGLGDRAPTVPLNTDPMGDGQRPVAGRIEHVDLAVGWNDVEGPLEGAAGLGHGTGISVEAEAGHEHALRVSGHAGKCGDDEREKNCGLGHG